MRAAVEDVAVRLEVQATDGAGSKKLRGASTTSLPAGRSASRSAATARTATRGDSERGCVPLLTMLTPERGGVMPELERMRFDYRLRVPLLTPRASIALQAPAAASR